MIDWNDPPSLPKMALHCEVCGQVKSVAPPLGFTPHEYVFACLACVEASTAEPNGYIRWEAKKWGGICGLRRDYGFAGMFVKPEELAALEEIAAGRAWKVSYNRLELLIERGLVNTTGARLTERGNTHVRNAEAARSGTP